jgi:hypothetical protein
MRNMIMGGLDEYSEVELLNGPRFFRIGYIVPGPGIKLEARGIGCSDVQRLNARFQGGE